MTIRAYAAKNAIANLESYEYEPEPLGPFDVEIRVTHCGICHSDIHLIDNDWGITSYPLVPGHEIIGTVSDRGGAVSHLDEGMRVGVGWQRSACFQCDQCLRGCEHLCPQIQDTCVGYPGGFAEAIRIDSRFVFPIPDEFDSAAAAPLLCGGATVYSALVHHGVRHPMRVAVIGLGGLGHLAVQFARAMGCEVTVFSSSPDKEYDAKELGANHFVVLGHPGLMEQLAATQDFILSTTPADLDWEGFADTLRPDGKLCFVGVPRENIQIPAFTLIVARTCVCGSTIGSRSDIREMLEFAARHRIEAQIERAPLHEVNTAVDRVRKNLVRYRLVLER